PPEKESGVLKNVGSGFILTPGALLVSIKNPGAKKRVGSGFILTPGVPLVSKKRLLFLPRIADFHPLEVLAGRVGSPHLENVVVVVDDRDRLLERLGLAVHGVVHLAGQRHRLSA